MCRAAPRASSSGEGLSGTSALSASHKSQLSISAARASKSSARFSLMGSWFITFDLYPRRDTTLGLILPAPSTTAPTFSTNCRKGSTFKWA